jgi:hypothetical protein
MTINNLAKATGKSAQYLMNHISRYKLTKTKNFSQGYATLFRKLIALSLCSVPLKEIEGLLSRERTLLALLKADSLTDAPTWFEDLCVSESGSTRLLLSGYDLGHSVTANGVQTALDFADREPELFSSREMGADVLRALRLYAEAHNGILKRLRSERKVLAASLKWARQVCRTT